MAQTIKEVISGLTGIVIREGDRFKLREEVEGIPPIHPRIDDYLRSTSTYLSEQDAERLISIFNEAGLVIKALVKDADSDHTCVRYLDANEDVSLFCEDSSAYAGYRLVLWGDLATQGIGYRKDVKPPVIRYLKPEK